MKKSHKFRYGYSALTLHEMNNLFALDMTKQQAIKNENVKHSRPSGFMGQFQLIQSDQNNDDWGKVYQSVETGAMVIPTGGLYIEFQPKLSTDAQMKYLNSWELQIIETISDNEYFVQSEETDTIPLTMLLQSMKTVVKVAEPDLMATVQNYNFPMPTDELMSKQWYLENKGKDPNGTKHWKYKRGADGKVVDAWKVLWDRKGHIGSDTVTIAVIDKGFDLSHPDFKGKVVAPRDFHHESNPNSSAPFTVKESHRDVRGNIYTDADHGTSCAGIALASSNGEGIVGVAPNAKFMPIRYHVANGRYLRKMFRHIMKNGGDIISCSFGHIGIPMDRLTIKTIHKCATHGRDGKGCIILFATGNAYDMLSNNELATHPEVIAVGASTSEDTFAPYTNRTKNMSVVAPGGYGHTGTMTTADVGMITTDTGDKIDVGYSSGSNPYYRFNAEGTSFACPLVAGVCSLILSANPDLTATEVKSIIETTADKIGSADEYDANGHSVKYGYGRVNAANAVRKALDMPLVNYSSEPADITNVADFHFDYGMGIDMTHSENSEELVVQFPIHQADAGKALLVELDVPLNHDDSKEFELYIQFGKKPVFFPEDFIQKHLSPMPRVKIHNTQPGTYFVMVRCIDKSTFQYIKGGGDFELTFTLTEATA